LYSADVGGDSPPGGDRLVVVIEEYLTRAQKAALADPPDVETVRYYAELVLRLGAASQDAQWTAEHLLLIAEGDVRSPRGGAPSPTLPSVLPAGARRPDRQLPPPRGAGLPFTSDKSSQSVPAALLRLFYSYVDADADYRAKLRRSLAMVLHSDTYDIEEWDREMVQYGEDQQKRIDQELNRADIILLLISQDYFAEANAADAEVRRALLRYANGEARVVPILLKSAVLPDEVGKLKPLPPDGNPVTLWPNEDEAFTKIAQGIKKLCKDLANEMKPSSLSSMADVRKRPSGSADAYL